MKKILYIVRGEPDFERVVCLAIAGKEKYEQFFVFVGDSSLFYADGIQNKFQRKLFSKHGFTMLDVCDFNFLGKILKIFSLNRNIDIYTLIENRKLFIPYLFNRAFRRYVDFRKRKIISNILKKISPDLLLTDHSRLDKDYKPEIFRNTAIQMSIPVYIFTHGAAGGLHSAFSNLTFDSFDNCTVLACSRNEPNSGDSNRIILGDMSSSYPYVHYLNRQEIDDIQFLNERKYKLGFMVGNPGPFTSTTGLHTIEDIIVDLSENPDVAMVLKLHPRGLLPLDLRLLEKFDNLLIVKRETDRSRVSKWADIVVCSDHCSTIFEPMILGKRVVAIEGRHIPKYKNHHSPLKNSSINHISSADEFDLETLCNADPEDAVTNTVAWGENRNIDLAELVFEKIENIQSDKTHRVPQGHLEN